ncbi:MAG: GumC family protein [Xenococcaceae cyanobacterium]
MENTRSDQFVALKNNDNGHQVYSGPIVHQTGVGEDEEKIDLRQLWTVIKRRMPFFLAVAIGVTVAAGFWSFNQKPRYQSKFLLLVGSPIRERGSALDKQSGLIGKGISDIDYETQIEVLLSPSVMNPIIKNKLSLKYPEINYYDLVFGALRIRQLRKTKILEVSYQDEDPEKVQFVLETLAETYLNYRAKERLNEIDQGIKFVQERLPDLRNEVNTLQQKLQNFRQQYNFFDPEQTAGDLSARLVTLDELYLEAQVELKEANSLYVLLQKQLGIEPNQALAGSYLTESPRYQNLLDMLQEVELELVEKSAIFLDESPTIQALKDRRESLLPLLRQEAQIVLGKNFSGSAINSPALTSPSELRLELNQQYIETANQIQILQLRQSSLLQAINSLKQQIKQLPVVAREYTNLLLEIEVATEGLNRFLAAEQDLQLEGAKKVTNWKIISKAEKPESPFFPNPPRHLSLGMIAGLFLGLGAALLAEQLDPTFHSSTELKESVQLPILARIPFQKDLKSVEEVQKVGLPQLQVGDRNITIEASDSNDGKPQRYTAFPFLEAFRYLNTNIRLLGSQSRTNSIVITSSAPAEGKSTVSVNLAKAAADMGQQVLLVDADLRRPQVHCRLGLENNHGLSNVIIDENLDLEEVIQRLPQKDNLSVLTAGHSKADPTMLLSSGRMQQLMKQLQTKALFDLVIYDLPPILGFADATILAPATDGVILVVKMGKTERSAVKQSIEQLKISQVSVLGVVANSVSNHAHGSSHYYYSYYTRDR